MKILIIGGTAFFGKVLVEQLLRAGHEITLLTRGNSRPKSFWSQIKHIECDRTNYFDFKSKLKELVFDVVIDNVVSGQSDIESIIDVFGSREISPHYIFCSTVAVYPDWSKANAPITEEAATLDLIQGNEWKITYANGKRSAEKYLIEHHGKMPYTIMRPTVIEGAEDPHKRTLFWIQRINDGNPIIVSTKDLPTLYRHVSPKDVAQAFFLAVGNKKAYNQIYNVAGEEILSIKQYVTYIAKVLQKREVALCWIPDNTLHNYLNGYMLPQFFNNVRLISDIKKIKKELGYEPQKTSIWIEETIKAFSNDNTISFSYENRKEEIDIAKLYKKTHITHIPRHKIKEIRIN